MNHFATPPLIPSNGCSCLYHKIISCVSEIPIELGVLIVLVSPNPAALPEEGWSLRSGVGRSVGTERSRSCLRQSLGAEGPRPFSSRTHLAASYSPSSPCVGDSGRGCGRGTSGPLRLSWRMPSTERFYLTWHEESGRRTILTSNPIPSFNWLCDLRQVA